MNKNIFEGAEFGDKFITKNHDIALFIRHEDEDFNSYPYILLLGYDKKYHAYNSYGTTIHDTVNIIVDDGYDIKSRYQEPIDEDKLDELASEYALEELGKEHYPEFSEMKRDFKAGYRSAFNNKAME